jgi:hypothetical protein
MALLLARDLPDAIDAAIDDAVQDTPTKRARAALRRLDTQIADRRRELQRLERAVAVRKASPRSKPAILSEALAEGRTTAERVAAVLKVTPADVAAIAAGRVGLGSETWRRLLKEIGK